MEESSNWMDHRAWSSPRPLTMNLECAIWCHRSWRQYQCPQPLFSLQWRVGGRVSTIVSWPVDVTIIWVNYFLIDDIYLKWPMFVKIIVSNWIKKNRLAQKHEFAKWPTIQRFLGTVHKHEKVWAYVGPKMCLPISCMYMCTILHNTIVEIEEIHR